MLPMPMMGSMGAPGGSSVRVLGPELWGTPAPIIGTGWTDNLDGSYTHVAGTASNLQSASAVTATKYYRVYFVVSGRTAGNVRGLAGSTGSGPFTAANGPYEYTLLASGIASAFVGCTLDFAGTVSDISVREVS